MLISSVNFINRGRGEKYYRREKDRDVLKEKTEDLTYCKKHTEKALKSKKFVKSKEGNETVSDTGAQNDISSTRTSGYGSAASVTSCDNSLNSPALPTDRVSIATVDEYNLYIDPCYYFVTLRKQQQITKCSSFNRHVISTRAHENGGKEQTVQLCLTCDPDFFLTTDANRQLELKSFEVDEATSDLDERLFTIHESATGQSFIQPTNHKGYYLHHLDNKLSVSKLELHRRPPEEYVFHVHSHGNTCLQIYQKDKTASKHIMECQTISANLKHSNPSPTAKMQFQCIENGNQSSSCAYQSESTSLSTCKCDCLDNLHSNQCLDTLSRLNSDVIKLGRPLRTATNKMAETEKPETKKIVQGKRNSFYNVVSMTGSCFGFGSKPED